MSRATLRVPTSASQVPSRSMQALTTSTELFVPA